MKGYCSCGFLFKAFETVGSRQQHYDLNNLFSLVTSVPSGAQSLLVSPYADDVPRKSDDRCVAVATGVVKGDRYRFVKST